MTIIKKYRARQPDTSDGVTQCWLKPIQSVVRSKARGSLNYKEKRAIVRAVSGGFVTGTVLNQWGYRCNGRCVYCGVFDTLAHRIFECPLIDKTDRDRWIPKAFRDMASASELQRWRLSQFLFTCPPVLWEAPPELEVVARASLEGPKMPVDSLYAHVQAAVADAFFQDSYSSGGGNFVVYSDGSCFGAGQEKFASAGGAAVLAVAGCSEPVAILEALVPLGSPATSQTAEFLGGILANRLATIVTGCCDTDLCGHPASLSRSLCKLIARALSICSRTHPTTLHARVLNMQARQGI